MLDPLDYSPLLSTLKMTIEKYGRVLSQKPLED